MRLAVRNALDCARDAHTFQPLPEAAGTATEVVRHLNLLAARCAARLPKSFRPGDAYSSGQKTDVFCPLSGAGGFGLLYPNSDCAHCARRAILAQSADVHVLAGASVRDCSFSKNTTRRFRFNRSPTSGRKRYRYRTWQRPQLASLPAPSRANLASFNGNRLLLTG